MTDQVTAKGQSGQSYQFDVHPVGTAFNAIPGVYVFLQKTGQGGWNANYVGETSDLNQRLNMGLQNHQAWPCGKHNGTTHFGAMVVNDGNQARINIETDLRHALNPVCNLQ